MSDETAHGEWTIAMVVMDRMIAMVMMVMIMNP